MTDIKYRSLDAIADDIRTAKIEHERLMNAQNEARIRREHSYDNLQNLRRELSNAVEAVEDPVALTTHAHP